MKRTVLLLAVLSAHAHGQASSSADSLKTVLRSLTGAARLPALVALVNKIESKDPKEALRYAAEGIALASRAGDKERQAAFLSSTAFSYSLTGELALALQYANETLELSRQIGNRDRMAKAHGTLGATYTFMGQYSKALEHNLEALRIREELSLGDAAAQSMNNIGILYHHIGQYDKAIAYYRQSLQRIAHKPDTSRVKILTTLNIGFSEYKRGQLEVALKIELDALALAHQANNATTAYGNFLVGITQTDLGHYAEALKYLQLSQSEYQAQDQKHGLVQVLNALGRLTQKTGAVARAIAYVQQSATLSRQIRAEDELKASYELLATLYEAQGSTAAAFTHYKLFVAMRDSLFSAQETDKIAEASMKIVTLKKDNEIESLKREQVIAALQLDRQHYYSTILVVILVSLATVIAILFRYSGQLRHGKASLEISNAELARLNAELQEHLQEIKTLSGLLPICAWCKNIRDDHGYWQQLEGYIADHSAAHFTHGICPSCAAKTFPEGGA